MLPLLSLFTHRFWNCYFPPNSPFQAPNDYLSCLLRQKTKFITIMTFEFDIWAGNDRFSREQQKTNFAALFADLIVVVL